MPADETAAVEPTGAQPDEQPVPEQAPLPGTTPPSRSARRIVAAVVVAALLLAGLAAWVLVVPYEVERAGTAVACDDLGEPPAPSGPDDLALAQDRVEARRRCDDLRESRRNVALFAGAAVAIAACAVSTVPSRRLTGEKLGPLR